MFEGKAARSGEKIVWGKVRGNLGAPHIRTPMQRTQICKQPQAATWLRIQVAATDGTVSELKLLEITESWVNSSAAEAHVQFFVGFIRTTNVSIDCLGNRGPS